MSASDKREALRKREGTFLVFETTHLTMKVENFLNKNGIGNRLFPKAKGVVSKCGLMVKVLESDLERVKILCENEKIVINEVVVVE